MAEYEPYEINDNGRIIPTYERRVVKVQTEAPDFQAALQKMLTKIGFEDAGLSDRDESLQEWMKKEIPEIFSAHFIDPEEALSVLTGIRPRTAAFLFKWEGKAYFTMRPDFGLLCIMSNFNEMPINCYESGIREQLLRKASEEIESIFRAIKNDEILKGGKREAPFEQWTALFQKRGFDLSHVPQEFLNDPLSVLKEENTALKADLEQSEKKINELSVKMQQYEKRLAAAGELDPRAERTYLNIIGVLLECVTGIFKDEKFSSEAELRDFIAEKFDDLRGVAPRTLADKFALAKKALNGELD
jgi:hypothetical protein